MWDKANLMLVGGADTPWHWGHSGWGWAMGFHGLIWLLFLAVVVFAVVLLVRWAAPPAPGSVVPPTGR
jgi:hypothetical protein